MTATVIQLVDAAQADMDAMMAGVCAEVDGGHLNGLFIVMSRKDGTWQHCWTGSVETDTMVGRVTIAMADMVQEIRIRNE